MQKHREWMERFSQKKFFFLFLGLLVYLVVYPYVQETGFGFIGFRVFASIILLLSVYAVSYRRRFAVLALGLAIPTLLQRIVLPIGEASSFSLVIASFSFLFDICVVVLLFRRVFANAEPTSETVFGALCIYLLIGFSFANGYLLVSSLRPHAFVYDPLANFPKTPGRFTFIYYSFATMTSVGAVGMEPATNEARSLTIIQAVLGLLYLAVLISRLMSLYTSNKK